MLIGIDIGSLAVSSVLFDERGQVAETFYEFHEGQIASCLQKLAYRMPGGMQTGDKSRIALTSSSRLNINGLGNIDVQTAPAKARMISSCPTSWLLPKNGQNNATNWYICT